LGEDLSQSLPLIRRIDTNAKHLAHCLMSRPGALNRDLRIATEGDQFLSALKPIAVLPIAPAFGRGEEAEVVTEGYTSGIAHHLASHPRAGAWRGRL
jgi:hypothetical protein